MAVELTSPVKGLAVGDSYTGPQEAFFLAEGYAKQAAYAGPGVAETGPASCGLDDTPTEATNREAPWWPADTATNADMSNDTQAKLQASGFPAPNTDFDPGGVDDDV